MRWSRRPIRRSAAPASGSSVATARGSRDAGFTLIEVLVAIVILAIISLFASQLVLTGIRSATNLDRYQTAVAVATMQMESIRSFDPAPTAQGVSSLISGRPKLQQLSLFNTSMNPAAAAVADVVGNTYPEWDPTMSSGATDASPTAVVPPTGVDSLVEQDGATTIYRDAEGNRVYKTAQLDSFGTALWSTDAAGTSLIQAFYQKISTGGAPYTYRNVDDPTQTIGPTSIAPTTTYAGVAAVVQSTVTGYPSGQVTLNGTVYTTTVLLGACFVHSTLAALSADVNGQCGRIDAALTAAGYTAPSSASAYNSPALPQTLQDYTKLVRVIVVVQWTVGASCSVSAPCSYALTSEFLPNIKDLLWKPST